MAAKMAAKIRFILKMVCIYELDGVFAFIFYKNHSLLSTNYFLAFGIIEHFKTIQDGR